MTGEKLRRGSMWLLASGVAAIAAIVSYSHIYDLGRIHGGTGTAARLLPLSVDMLILVGELMLLHENDDRDSRFWLGWALVWSGILATLAANVTYGAQFGVEGAIIWGWPAYSFIMAAASMVAIVKRGGSAALRTDRTGGAGGVDRRADDNRTPLAGREAIVADLAEQIRNAITWGEKWQPDYPALMVATGYQRSWCEKAVREARTVAAISAMGGPAPASMNGHAP